MNIIKVLLKLKKQNIFLSKQGTELSIVADRRALTATIQQELKNSKQHILECFAQFEISSNKQLAPLSFNQRSMWLLDQMVDESVEYIQARSLRLRGEADVETLTKTFNHILSRHESLRTNIVTDGEGDPWQRILDHRDIELEVIDLSDMAASEKYREFERLNRLQRQTPFCLAEDLMIRAQIVILDKDNHAFLYTLHHIASDRWSLTNLERELTISFKNFSQGNDSPLAELIYQYADYAHAQSDWLEGDEYQNQLSVLCARLDDIPLVHSLPLDYMRPAVQKNIGSQYNNNLSASKLKKVDTLCLENGVTLYMALQTIFSILLARYSNETDIVMGTPIANREKAQVEPLIGFLANTLVLRSDLSGQPSFSELLERNKQMLLDSYACQQVPFEMVVEQLQPQRSLSYSPLFQIMLVLQNKDESTETLPGAKLGNMTELDETAKYDITLNITRSSKGLNFRWEYDTSLFKPKTIARMAAHFEILLDAMLNNVKSNIMAVPLVDSDEQKEIYSNSKAKGNFISNTLIHELFERHAEIRPNEIAVVCGDENITYRELNNKANQIAHYLRAKHQIQPDTLVGLSVERSINTILGILAILKAGGAYVPLDPSYPQERLNYIADDAAVEVVLTDKAAFTNDEFRTDITRIRLDTHSFEEFSSANIAPLSIGLTAGHMAYVIYTSGSTGKPKGVMVEHTNVSRLFDCCEAEFNFDHEDVWTMFHSYAFDFSVWEIWGALSRGGKLIVVPYLTSRSPSEFYQLLLDEKVTVLNQTPSAFNAVINEDKLHANRRLTLKHVIFGGEALNLKSLVPWVEKYGDDTRLVNMYGITETTVHVTYKLLDRDTIINAAGASLIGRPLADLSCIILNECQQMVPVGVVGELYVGGDGVTRGYLNMPDLTAERFVDVPGFEGQLFYRSGDLARFTDTFEMAYMGRIDHQVKIRGFRIELGEIQKVLTDHPSVDDALILVSDDDSSQKRIIAYLEVPEHVAQESNRNFICEVRQYLTEQLPSHMIPSAFVVVNKFPLTTNGKIDRKALPKPDFNQQSEQYTAPQTALQMQLCDVWQQVLKIDRVGVSDNFFNIGGDSILAIKVVTLAKALHISISVRDIFAAQTIFGLVALLEQKTDVDELDTDVQPFELLNEEELQSIKTYMDKSLLEDAYPLSMTQEGMLLHYNLNRKEGTYHDLFDMTINMVFDELAFSAALESVIEVNELLRSKLYEHGRKPLQLIFKEINTPLRVIDLREFDKDEQAKIINSWGSNEKVQGFSPDEPIWRITIHRLSDNKFHYGLSMLHSLLDGWSVASMQSLLMDCYLKLLAGEALEKRFALPYRYFIAQEKSVLASEKARSFWLSMLNDPELPAWTGTQKKGSHIVNVKLKAEESLALSGLAKKLGVQEKAVLLAAHFVLCGYINGKQKVTTSSVYNARPEMNGSERTLGLFLNSLPLTAQFNGLSWDEFIVQLNGLVIESMQYRQYPLIEVQRHSGLNLSASLFNFTNFHVYDHLKNHIFIDNKQIFEETNYNYIFHASGGGDKLAVNLRLDTGVFDAEAIERIGGYAESIFYQIISQSDKVIDESAFMSAGEAQVLLSALSTEISSRVELNCIHQRFESQVEARSQDVAVVIEDENNNICTLTYGELNRRANQVAHALLEKYDVKPDTMIGLYVERSIDMMVGILGILKAGGAYVPLDPDYPKDRLQHIFEDAGLNLVVSQSKFQHIIDALQCDAVLLDCDDFSKFESHNPDYVELGLTSQNLAYVIYTSGSTGKPKGCMVDHANVVRLFDSCDKDFHFDHTDIWTMFHSYAFDFSVWEIWGALTKGGRVVLVPYWLSRSPTEFYKLLQRHKVTVLNQTPSAFNALVTEDLQHQEKLVHLRHVIFGGEALSLESLRPWVSKYSTEQPSLVNMYGITETTVHVTYRRLSSTDVMNARGQSLIGHPLSDLFVVILNENKALVPTGVVGEMYVGGAGVTRGYLNRPELNEQRFVTIEQFGDSKLYRTGDLGRLTSSGELEYCGRADQQVKIRGFRIELGEIEYQIRQLSGIDKAIVVVRDFEAQGKQLVCYFSVKNYDAALNDKHLIMQAKSSLSQSLPGYMIPAIFVLVKDWCMTANGKIDIKALPNPEWSLLQGDFVAAESEIEIQLRSIWSELLALDEATISVTANFSQLGGHSLLASRLLLGIKSEFGIEVGFRDIFEHQTIREQGEFIANRVWLTGDEALVANSSAEEEFEELEL